MEAAVNAAGSFFLKKFFSIVSVRDPLVHSRLPHKIHTELFFKKINFSENVFIWNLYDYHIYHGRKQKFKKISEGKYRKIQKNRKCIVSKIFTKKQDSVFNLTSYSNSVKSTQKY